ncbi:gluconate 2-dehydrogenase subunit 3 family protein [Sphingobium chungangianum]
MADPFPDYDVLSKRGSLSWNRQTRAVIDERLAMREAVEALGVAELETLHVLVAHVAPEPEGRTPTNTVALLLQKIADNGSDGYRPARMPQTQAVWRLALAGLEAEARARWSAPFRAADGRADRHAADRHARGTGAHRRLGGRQSSPAVGVARAARHRLGALGASLRLERHGLRRAGQSARLRADLS